MKIQLIRHATLLIYANNKKILVDPMLSSAGTMAAIPDVANTNNNPLIDLPVNIQTIVNSDAVLLTHTHRDHFDSAAIQLLSKHIPIFCQPQDAEKLSSEGFLNVNPIDKSLTWSGITFKRTQGQHGYEEMAAKMGPVSGFVITASGEKSVYITGDSIWCTDVERAINEHHPNIVICYAGGAQFNTGGPITMTAQDIYDVCKAIPDSIVIAVHMEAWNHCSLSRDDLKNFIVRESLDTQVYVPKDGEVMIY